MFPHQGQQAEEIMPAALVELKKNNRPPKLKL
jgi:hypothetical protein